VERQTHLHTHHLYKGEKEKVTSCELCGKQATTKARIEGAVLSACASCATLGTEIKAPPAPTVRRAAAPTAETFLVPDAGQRIRAARNRMKLNEKEAAQKLGIKENTLLHIESGKLQPDESTTKKLERFFNITLMQTY
jgi:uncharacterized protein (TIGR00270 family)